ncbi:MAG: D-alanyl-D-alanine carboxypeptidase [Deltaproteobacteria bacterium]|nr:D-alanyl-D-alanine carboxypeptidase [Deltaproteobacteria bacterium]
MEAGGIPIAKRIPGPFAILWILLLWPGLSAAGDIRLAVRSAILMDMTTGRILFTHNADDPLPPASITKVLSLYLADEAIRNGKVRPTDPVRISRKAGQTGGSRMFIQAGSEIPLKELLKGMAVVSANDASVAVAEYIGGNVEEFVEQMNRKARELGMNRSFFKNPNGLPARGQLTTARDVMILAKDYLRRFPESLDLHSQQYYTHRDITQRNRNSLLRNYPDADGLKTGWIAKAGYHIVATAKRGNTRLIAVVMGAKTYEIRARETEKLLDEGFRMVREDPLRDRPVLSESYPAGYGRVVSESRRSSREDSGSRS